ncbi:hypothetical protein HanIR_Chr15g0743981 [Helianthus annuus]|nr:hypothetical protein HanIR_Chr15g0743981 [Helianthus annuus]
MGSLMRNDTTKNPIRTKWSVISNEMKLSSEMDSLMRNGVYFVRNGGLEVQFVRNEIQYVQFVRNEVQIHTK